MNNAFVKEAPHDFKEFIEKHSNNTTYSVSVAICQENEELACECCVLSNERAFDSIEYTVVLVGVISSFARHIPKPYRKAVVESACKYALKEVGCDSKKEHRVRFSEHKTRNRSRK